MKKFLRLDMYINGKEFLILEGQDFEECLNASDIIDGRIAQEIRTLGVSNLPFAVATEAQKEMIWEATGIDVEEGDEVNFCMCIWRGEGFGDDVHLHSAVPLEMWEQADDTHSTVLEDEIKELIELADTVKDYSDWDTANAVFKFILLHAPDSVRWELETRDPHGEYDGEAYYDLAVMRTGDAYLNIPFPLLNEKEAGIFLSLKPAIVDRLVHNRSCIPYGYESDEAEAVGARFREITKGLAPDFESDPIKRELTPAEYEAVLTISATVPHRPHVDVVSVNFPNVAVRIDRNGDGDGEISIEKVSSPKSADTRHWMATDYKRVAFSHTGCEMGLIQRLKDAGFLDYEIERAEKLLSEIEAMDEPDDYGFINSTGRPFPFMETLMKALNGGVITDYTDTEFSSYHSRVTYSVEYGMIEMIVTKDFRKMNQLAPSISFKVPGYKGTLKFWRPADKVERLLWLMNPVYRDNTPSKLRDSDKGIADDQ